MSLDLDLVYEAEFLGSLEDVQAAEFNITHNLNTMAEEAGIYKCLWRPEENGFEKAGDIISLLEKAIKELEKRPEHFKKFDAENGWGTYEHFVPFVKEVLLACKTHPKATLKAWR